MIRKIVQSYAFLVAVSTLWAGVFFILPDFSDNPVDGARGWAIAAFHWGLIVTATYLLISLSALSKYVFAVFMPVFNILGAITGFYRYSFKATLTPMIVDAALNNDIGTTMDVVSPELILFVLLNFAISVFFIWYRFRKVVMKSGWLHATIGLVLLTLLFSVNDRVRASIMQRFPFNVVYSLSEYMKYQRATAQERIDFEPDFVCSETVTGDSLTVVFVMGESARAANFSLNGYSRLTNPRLGKRSNVVSFPYIFSEYTYTNRSIPHIITRADSVTENRAFTEKSFISLFEKCDYRTEWISNQDPAESYISLMHECDTILYAHPEKSVYNYNNWVDEDLLPFVGTSLRKQYHRNLFMLHTIGSHWYYNNHYTQETAVFQPVTRSRIINQNSPEEIINAYDNSIVYTDFFLDSLISMLEHRNAVLIYLADHAETLGEDGQWLHASSHPTTRNPACLVWYSDVYAARNPEKVGALKGNKNKHLRTDFLFHSILSAAGIPAKSIQTDLDVFSRN